MTKFYIATLLILTNCFSAFCQDKYYSEWYLQRPDLDIYVREQGLGKDTVIVVHGGFGANHDYMLDAIKGLSDNFHFVLYDQRGSLLSPCDTSKLTFQKNVEDLYALVKALRIKKVKLFCHSMGTLVAMDFINQHPELVFNVVMTGAILAKSDSSKSVFSERVSKQVAYLQSRKEVQLLLKPYKDRGYDKITSFEALDTAILTQKQLTEVWRINFASVNIFNVNKFNLLKGGRAYYKGDASKMAETVNWNYDYRLVLNKLKKITFIEGDFDFLDFNSETHKSLLLNYENIKIKVIKNAGHNIWIDEPDKFRIALTDALQ
jgi:proline iminopeptidase